MRRVRCEPSPIIWNGIPMRCFAANPNLENNNRMKKHFPWILLLVPLLFLTGCGSTKSSRFYLLEPMRELPAKVGPSMPLDPCILGLGPVSLPDYLDRPQIVTRNAAHTVHMDEYERWSEPLRSNFSRVLAENLSHLLPGCSVVEFQWVDLYDAQYRIVVSVLRFDGALGAQAVLEAQWSVVGRRAEILVAPRMSRFSERVSDSSHGALVAAQSRTLAGLSQDIAATVETLSPKFVLKNNQPGGEP
jgi:uncharacterized protein